MNRRESGHERAQRQWKSLARTLALLCGLVLLIVLVLRVVVALRRSAQYRSDLPPSAARGILPPQIRRVQPRDKIASQIVAASHQQIGTVYDASYQTISYPNGDVDQKKGACTDVIVRALRTIRIDLQRRMHEDMKANFHLYPRKWGLPRPDKNIDHRRVPNQMKFFERFGISLTLRADRANLSQWQPGDFIFWDMGNGQQHTGIISDGVNQDGVPLVIHNGYLCVEDDSLTRWKIIGHFRYPKRQSH